MNHLRRASSWGRFLAAMAAAVILPVRGQDGVPRPREFPVGALKRLEELPEGPFRRQLERLPDASRQRAVSWLRSFHFCEHDVGTLHSDAHGGIFYADPATGRARPAVAESDPVTANAAVPVSPFPATLVLHSRPGAPNVIYLNFVGETVTGTEWNDSLGRSVIVARAFSMNADRTTFSDAEQLAIRRIWQRVAEDYAPFNVDVTTERPASFGNRTAHAVITSSTDANGGANPAASAGGVAYVNVFGTAAFTNYRPAWIYHDNLSDDESFIAEAVSHEIGHNLGLSHDGTTSGSEYYNGHGAGETSWGPLMGTGYDRNLSQWSKGEYYQANNQQDDLALIAGKLSYRTDDHGATTAGATALSLTGGTNITATTPATDPANLSPVNKGVIERANDVDTFAFVTGFGPVRFTVSTWEVPAGRTRGGNLDLQVQLLSSTGTVLLSVQPGDQTDAVVATNLTAGRYFLQVRNAAAGDPLTRNPTGYTAYGSLGQYFINGSVSQADGVATPPVAELQAPSLRVPGVGAHMFSVIYSDDFAVKVATLDGSDLRITGPNGFSRLARFVGANPASDGTPRTATYAVDPPSGATWLPADNGTYAVTLQDSQVSDTFGAFVLGGPLGSFEVSVPVTVYTTRLDVDPRWTMEGDWAYGSPVYGLSGPNAGFTGTKIIGYNLRGNYADRLTTRYATTPPIDTSGSPGLALQFHRWLRVQNGDTATIEISTNNTRWTRLWSSSRRVADTGWQEVRYPLPAGFAGSPTLRVRWGMGSNSSQNDIGWNLDDILLLSEDALDIQPPVPALAVAPLTVGGSPSHPCSVTFTDVTSVSLASLDSADLVIKGPNGFTGAVEFIGADLPADGTPVTATYSIPAPGGLWDAADNGTYAVHLVVGEVADTLENAVLAAQLGSFTVNIPASNLALVVSPVALDVTEGSEAAFTVRLSEKPTGPVNVTAQRQSGDESVTVKSGAALVFDGNTWATPVPVTLQAAPDNDDTASTALIEVRSAGLTPVTVLATKVDVPAGELGVLVPTARDSAGPAGGPFVPDRWTFGLTNSGGSPLAWNVTRDVAWLDWAATSGTLNPGTGTNLVLTLNNAATALAPGAYTATLGFANTTSGRGNTEALLTLNVRVGATAQLTVNLTPPAGGTVTPGSGSYAAGLEFALRATPAPYYTFTQWRGGLVSTANPVLITLTGDRTVEAVFREQLTVNQPTPLWWLAAHGITNNFETAVLATGSNGLPRWQSYVAGLDPNNPASRLRLELRPAADFATVELLWDTVTNRVYSLWLSPAVAAPFTPVAGAQALPATTKQFQHAPGPAAGSQFYQLRVELP